MPELICDYCDADCSGGSVQTRRVKFKRSDGGIQGIELVGKGVRCHPACEPALQAARDLLAELKREQAGTSGG